MDRSCGDNLPVVKERTISESEYLRLSERAGRTERLENRVSELEREIADLRRGAEPVEELMAGLLPSLDDFERAIVAARAARGFDAVLEGVGMVRSELGRVLHAHGLEPIGVEPGDPYDFRYHETPGDDGFPGEEAVVETVLRAGYRRGDRVLRRALVLLRGSP